jgi:DNA-binding PadR family transcriptional regulator
VPGRIPQLRYEILECLAINGRLSKSIVEQILTRHKHNTKTGRSVKHHRTEILQSFESLEYEEFIKKLDANPGQGIIFGRGRPKTYYKITEKGLDELIEQILDPEDFWYSVVGYSHHSDRVLGPDKIEKLYQLFMKRYLKYPDHGFSFQLDIFDNMRDRWFQDMIQGSNKISLTQKILEILSIHPRMTLKQLALETKENESDLLEVLSTYTSNSYKPDVIDNEYYKDQNLIGKKYNKKYWNFLRHNIVIARYNEHGIATYELSLFGIILVLTIIRYNGVEGLYYSNISFLLYYDKIASNYQNKLPLVFGKWNLLKTVLKEFSAYNFDIILDRDVRIKGIDRLSITAGGNKELYDTIQEIVLHNLRQLAKFAEVGLAILWSNYILGAKVEIEHPFNQTNGYYLINDKDQVWHDRDPSKVHALYLKFKEIMLLLNPLDHGFDSIDDLQPQNISDLLQQAEEWFADEITTFYYMNLYDDFQIQISGPRKYSSLIQGHDLNSKPLNLKPKDCLLAILEDKNKPLIKDWLSKWIYDITNFQKEVFESIKSIVV